jgi:DNA-binding IclR family transcriptional regulator
MGGRPPSISDSEILQFFIETSDPFLTTNEVADLAEMSQQGAYNRLVDLQESGYIKSKSMGNARGWWITHGGRELAREDERNG